MCSKENARRVRGRREVVKVSKLGRREEERECVEKQRSEYEQVKKREVDVKGELEACGEADVLHKNVADECLEWM